MQRGLILIVSLALFIGLSVFAAVSWESDQADTTTEAAADAGDAGDATTQDGSDGSKEADDSDELEEERLERLREEARQRAQDRTNRVMSASAGNKYIEFDPEVVDFGTLMKGDRVNKTVTLTNKSDTAVSVIRALASCVCTVPRFEKRTLEQGQSMDVELEYFAKRDGDSSVNIHFLLDDNRGSASLKTVAHTKPVVSFSPEEFDHTFERDQTVTIRSHDGQAFRIMSSSPRLVTDLPTEEAVEHTVTLPADAFGSLSSDPRYIRLYTDHPRESSIVLRSDKVAPADQTRKLINWAGGYHRIDDLEQFLQEGAALTQTDAKGMTLLMYAAAAGEAARVRVLLEEGLDVNAQRSDRRTALMSAALSGNVETMRALIDAGANVNLPDKFGRTALYWAARTGEVDRIHLLLEHGALVDARGPNDETPLMSAVKSRTLDVVKALVEAGADVTARDTRGRTATQQALERVRFMRDEAKADLQEVIDYLRSASAGG